MFGKSRLKYFTKHLLRLMVVLFAVLAFGGMTQAADSPQAGTWATWVLASGDQFPVDAPPDEAATADEIAQLIEMAASRDDAALAQIAYWNAGPPSYRWNQIAMNEINRLAMPANTAYRGLALMNVAIYDATVAAWDSKYAYNRPRPSDVDPVVIPVIPNPSSPSYPSEYAVTAGAASAILGWWFPEKAQMFEDKAQEAVNSRLMAGVEYPSDVEAGLELGRQVAALVIERGNADGSDAAWTGTVPTDPTGWTGENPILPMAGTWDTWVLESPDQFRPAPPPAYDSEQLAAEMQELRDFERTPVTNSIALFWEYGAGGRRNQWLWNDILSRLILQSYAHDDAPMAARAYALLNTAANDAAVACWDGKYAYWAIRPFQLDPEFKTLFATPNHPAYPSSHSCTSNAVAGVTAYLFPTDAEEVLALAHQASESRIWAGIHFRSDVDAGIKIGEDVANAVIERAMSDGS
jgi:membrane-associated phospholipid phosphatase